MPTLSNLISERELIDFSQNFGVVRSYMGSRLFPDRKTQYIQQEYSRFARNANLPMAAMVHALDTEAHIGSRVPFEAVNVEELLIKEKINLTESTARLTRGLDMPMDSLRRYVFDDVANMAERVVTRVEVAKMDAVAKGKYTISENGLGMEIDYGVPEDNFVTGDWGDADADILGDVRKWRLQAVESGTAPDIVITTEKVLLAIMSNKGVQSAIFGTTGAGTLPNLDQVNSLFRSQFGVYLQTNEEKYGEIVTGDDGKVKVEQRRFFPEGAFVMTATGLDGTLGIGLWGVTPEELEQGGAFDSKRQQQYVTVTTWDTPDPVATWTKASGLFIPVMPNIYGHMIATIDTADNAEG